MLSQFAKQTMVDALPVGACVFTGNEHTISAANELMLSIWNKNQSVIGKPLHDALPEIKEQGFFELLTNVYNTGQDYRNPNGQATLEVNGQLQERYFDFSFKPLRDEHGHIYGIINTAVDTTGQVLQRRADDQRKSDFIGIVSHELRSPLTSLKGFLQLLEIRAKKLDDPSVLMLAGRSARQVERMQKLISGFLDVARIGEAKLRLNLTPFDMADLVKTAEKESLASHTTHHIVFHPVEHTPVHADQDKIEQVLINFVNNAVKYSPPDTSINVRCITRNGQAYVSVSDEGMGIAEQDLPRVFDRFYRVEGHQTKLIKGFGIGLYICKEIIDLHHGQIGAESEIGKGSTFWFELPVTLS